mmetsp:Transcript_2331/g.6593  ORF Transcript_2331/g.6593 Transcript_2331/m.6593 type:complete len:320 (-) Transcript_2331:615-1574(-)
MLRRALPLRTRQRCWPGTMGAPPLRIPRRHRHPPSLAPRSHRPRIPRNHPPRAMKWLVWCPQVLGMCLPRVPMAAVICGHPRHLPRRKLGPPPTPLPSRRPLRPLQQPRPPPSASPRSASRSVRMPWPRARRRLPRRPVRRRLRRRLHDRRSSGRRSCASGARRSSASGARGRRAALPRSTTLPNGSMTRSLPRPCAASSSSRPRSAATRPPSCPARCVVSSSRASVRWVSTLHRCTMWRPSTTLAPHPTRRPQPSRPSSLHPRPPLRASSTMCPLRRHSGVTLVCHLLRRPPWLTTHRHLRRPSRAWRVSSSRTIILS